MTTPAFLSYRSTLVAALWASVLVGCAADTTTANTTNASGPARPVGGHSFAAFMGAYDINRDGKVTRDEYDTVRKQRFMAADTNNDGWLSEAEYVAEFEKRLKQQYQNDGKTVDDSYRNSMKQAYVRFGIVDRNKDGKYTIEEEIESANKTFKNNDTNGDGVVDARDKKD